MEKSSCLRELWCDLEAGHEGPCRSFEHEHDNAKTDPCSAPSEPPAPLDDEGFPW